MERPQRLSGLFIPAFLLAVWISLAVVTPNNVYWRDSGEFLLSALFLDIPHPTGFPLYSQLANLLALFPVGPIAWRVHSFSALLAVATLAALIYLCRLILLRYFKVGNVAATVVALLSALSMLQSSAFVRQAAMAEVYLLYLLAVELLLILYLRFIQTHDLRHILLAAFIAGLSLGNHVAIIPFIFLAIVLLGAHAREIKVIILPVIAFGLIGFSIYSYIPIRARQYPPLNTGQAVDAERFWALISDRRDRILRPEVLPGMTPSGESLSAVFKRHLQGDWRKLVEQVSTVVVVFALIGMVLVFSVVEWRFAVLLVGAMGSNWLFFQGWDPDPWGPLIFGAALCAAIAAGAAYGWIVRRWRGLAVPALAAAIVATTLLIAPRLRNNVESIHSYRGWNGAAQIVGSSLAPLPYGRVVVLEPSWFVARYLQKVEGLREDLALTYLPGLLFPAHFAPTMLVKEGGSGFVATVADPPRLAAPDVKGFARFIDFVTEEEPVSFEPVVTVNKRLREISFLGRDGYIELRSGKSRDYDPAFFSRYLELIDRVSSEDSGAVWESVQADSWHYLEVQIGNAAHLLKLTGNEDSGIELLARACLPVLASRCSVSSLNNLGVAYLSRQEFLKAARVFAEIIQVRGSVPEALRVNLRRSVLGINALERRQIEQEFKGVL